MKDQPLPNNYPSTLDISTINIHTIIKMYRERGLGVSEILVLNRREHLKHLSADLTYTYNKYPTTGDFEKQAISGEARYRFYQYLTNSCSPLCRAKVVYNDGVWHIF